MGVTPEPIAAEADLRLVDTANLREVIARAALTTAAIQSVTAVAGIAATRRDYADLIWGPGLAAIAVSSAVTGTGDPVRRWGLAAVSSGWAARLGSHMWTRITGADSEDARYTEFLEDAGPAEVFAKVFLTQGLAQLIVSAPIQLAAASRLPRSGRRRLVGIGLGLMVAGAVLEAVADRQKEEYSARDRDERPDVLDTGLWALSRHPNYFGDSVVWDGAWLAAAASPPALATFPAPIAMNYLLMVATGAKRTEKRMEDRPGYREYQQKVSFFFPWRKRR